MDARKRYMSVDVTMASDVKFRALVMLEGGETIPALGRWVSLLMLLRQYDGAIDWRDPLKRAVTCETLELGGDACEAFLAHCADAELIERGPWDDGVVVNRGMLDEIEYRKASAEAGRKGGRPRKKAGEAAAAHRSQSVKGSEKG